MKLRTITYYRQDHYGDALCAENMFDARENVVPRIGEVVILRTLPNRHRVVDVVYDQFKQNVEVYLRMTVT
jgi:hypothetical protein